jgi:hypothetical protein
MASYRFSTTLMFICLPHISTHTEPHDTHTIQSIFVYHSIKQLVAPVKEVVVHTYYLRSGQVISPTNQRPSQKQFIFQTLPHYYCYMCADVNTDGHKLSDCNLSST